MSTTNHSLYSSLDRTAQSIRLIEIVSGEDPLVRCQFHVFNLPDCPPYIALSYTWGAPLPTAEIIINGQQVVVRENLWLALGAIRNQIRTQKVLQISKCKFFWIDAVCINQDDALERNHQVRLMGEVYSQAEAIITWLGMEEDDSDMAMQLLLKASLRGFNEETARAKMSQDQKLSIRKLISKLSFWKSSTPQLLPELYDPKMREAILALFRRAYWTRLWIVQEVSLAKTVFLLCGSEICQLADIKTFIKMLNNSRPPGGIDFDEQMSRSAGCTLTLYHYSLASEKETTLATLINYWSSQDCVDPRDKVFGLLGMLPKHVRSSQDMLLPDYRKTMEQVFEDAMLHIKNYSANDSVTWKTANMLLLAKELGIERSASREEELNAFFSETTKEHSGGDLKPD